MRSAASLAENQTSGRFYLRNLNRAAGVAAVTFAVLGTINSARDFSTARGECERPDEIQPGCRYSERPYAFLLTEFKPETYTLSPCQSDHTIQCLLAVDESLLKQCDEAADIANRCQEGLRPELENVFYSLMAFSSVSFVVITLYISPNPSALQTTQGEGSPTTSGNETPSPLQTTQGEGITIGNPTT